jgi:hypothetical protein
LGGANIAIDHVFTRVSYWFYHWKQRVRKYWARVTSSAMMFNNISIKSFRKCLRTERQTHTDPKKKMNVCL